MLNPNNHKEIKWFSIYCHLCHLTDTIRGDNMALKFSEEIIKLRQKFPGLAKIEIPLE